MISLCRTALIVCLIPTVCRKTIGFQAVAPLLGKLCQSYPTLRTVLNLRHPQNRHPLWIPLHSSELDEIPGEKENNDEISIIEEEYWKRLKEAQAAVAAAEEARQKLLALSQEDGIVDANRKLLESTMLQSNDKIEIIDKDDVSIAIEEGENEMDVISAPNTRALISYSDAQTLEITLPPKNMGMNTLLSGAFSLAWFSAITPATLAARGTASLMFMLPFWVAGGAVAKAGVVDPLVRQKLRLGRYAFSLTKEIAGQTIQKVEKPTARIQGVSIRLVDIINEVPRYELELLMSGGADRYSFGIWTGDDMKKEAEELMQIIDRQLKKFRVSL
ncbi:hypothetical protein IV203_034102 [Nitzschia inconspicua]|uniref:Uncharacterized protein n=1 Tax=Nitzschia inconspicua TaxID=303405 RepID=A0A9K3Q710_9STRA|nr:hypothetical protein IV203_034102 [Nitzschia inconspicua]